MFACGCWRRLDDTRANRQAIAMPLELVATLVLALQLLAIAVIDARTLRIPDLMSLALFVTGLGATWLLGADLVSSLIGAALGYGAIAALNLAYRALRGHDGMGLGDAKLLAGAGAWLGWQGLPFVALLGSAAGLVFAAALRLAGKQIDATSQIAFGPFLCAAVFVTWLVAKIV